VAPGRRPHGSPGKRQARPHQIALVKLWRFGCSRRNAVARACRNVLEEKEVVLWRARAAMRNVGGGGGGARGKGGGGGGRRGGGARGLGAHGTRSGKGLALEAARGCVSSDNKQQARYGGRPASRDPRAPPVADRAVEGQFALARAGAPQASAPVRTLHWLLLRQSPVGQFKHCTG
jgi:hypothetical protein